MRDLVRTDLGSIPIRLVRQEDRVRLLGIDSAVERDRGVVLEVDDADTLLLVVGALRLGQRRRNCILTLLAVPGSKLCFLAVGADIEVGAIGRALDLTIVETAEETVDGGLVLLASITELGGLRGGVFDLCAIDDLARRGNGIVDRRGLHDGVGDLLGRVLRRGVQACRAPRRKGRHIDRTLRGAADKSLSDLAAVELLADGSLRSGFACRC